jgi:NRPS condensation-like uncharacterized protein
MKIELAPIDYYFYRPKLYTIQFAFEYNNKISTQRLSEASKELVVKMPVVGSRLKKISNFQVVLETGHEIPVREQMLDASASHESGRFFDSVSNAEGEPLIKILVSHTVGGSFVGFSFSHLLGDGAAFFMFMENLVQTIALQPITEVSVDRTKLSAFIKGDSKAGLFESTGYTQPRPKNPAQVDVEHIQYTHTHLNGLKDELKLAGCIASTNDIIMADLAKRFHQDIPKFENQFIVRCPVDYRKTIGIGANYFGNAVRDAVSFFSSKEMEEMSFAAVVGRIRQSILSVDELSVNQALTALDLLRRDKGIDVFQELGCPGLLVSNLSKFPISKIDLGSGAPAGFHHASLNPRLALVLPHPDGYMVKFKRPVS